MDITAKEVNYKKIVKARQIAEILRVDHAGEYGAKRIYEGQKYVLKDKESQELIEHMAAQEEEHLAYFDLALKNHQVRPTALMPLWHAAGFALGAVSALMGKKAAMACTVAVEEVIDAHYQEQLKELDYIDELPEAATKKLKENIEKFRQEELEHKNIGLENHAEQTFAYHLFKNIIKIGCHTAIELSKKI